VASNQQRLSFAVETPHCNNMARRILWSAFYTKKMELRKDPITRSWVVVGHPEREKIRPDPCPLCSENRPETRAILDLPAHGPWQVRVYPHFRPLYRIEGEPGRSAEGIYDRIARNNCRKPGAHAIAFAYER
jgi:hypothetical protein